MTSHGTRRTATRSGSGRGSCAGCFRGCPSRSAASRSCRHWHAGWVTARSGRCGSRPASRRFTRTGWRSSTCRGAALMPVVVGRVIAAIGLLFLGPLILALGAAVRLTSPGPALYRATRAGPHGTFTLHKLRTMRAGAATSGPGVTAAGDARVTRLGRLLRRTKLDELPQLWDVVRGQMALVGPRPEDPRYIDPSDPIHRAVFAALPGITGP